MVRLVVTTSGRSWSTDARKPQSPPVLPQPRRNLTIRLRMPFPSVGYAGLKGFGRFAGYGDGNAQRMF